MYFKLIKITLLYITIWSLTSCKNEVFRNHLPIVSNYFPNTEINSYSYIKINTERGKLKINNIFVKELEYKELFVLDTLKTKIPVEYKSFSNDSFASLNIFKDNLGNIFNFQFLNTSNESSFDFFKELYEISIIRDYTFTLSSAIFFKSKSLNFVTYDVHIVMEGYDKYILGLIYTKNKENFLDISFIKTTPLRNEDRVIFSELINSLKVREKYIIPFLSEIEKEMPIRLN